MHGKAVRTQKNFKALNLNTKKNTQILRVLGENVQVSMVISWLTLSVYLDYIRINIFEVNSYSRISIWSYSQSACGNSGLLTLYGRRIISRAILTNYSLLKAYRMYLVTALLFGRF